MSELISYSVECGPSSEDHYLVSWTKSSGTFQPGLLSGILSLFFCTSHIIPPEHSNGRGYTPVVDRFYVVPGHEVMPKNQTLP